MNDKEWEELLEARINEIMSKVMGATINRGYSLDDCKHAAKGIIGVRLGGDALDCIASAMFNRRGRYGHVLNLDDLVTIFNNLPLGLHIADLQRAEVLEDDQQLAEAVELQQQTEKSLEQLCDRYEQTMSDENHPQDIVNYVCALEDLVSEMQGKSFRDGSRIGQLEAENAALRSYLKVEAGKEPVKPS